VVTARNWSSQRTQAYRFLSLNFVRQLDELAIFRRGLVGTAAGTVTISGTT
jgi:hypothetical protein